MTRPAATIDDLWHAAYCRWYDHDQAGRRLQAAIWGRIADRICRRLQ